MADRPRIAVLSPNPLLSITIERRAGDDNLHIHVAGQGVWVARMARMARLVRLRASPRRG